MLDINQFLTKFTEWAKDQEGILAVALVGSHARGVARTDSDVDLVIIIDKPEIYLNSDQWIKTFGEVKELKKEDYKLVQARRVFYESGLEVEYGITTPEWAKTDPVDEGTRRVVTDGAKILCDKNGLLQLLLDTISR